VAVTGRWLDGLVAASTELRIVPLPSFGDHALADKLPSLPLNFRVGFNETLILKVVEASDGRHRFRLLAWVWSDRLRIPHLTLSGGDAWSVTGVARVDRVVGKSGKFARRDALSVDFVGNLTPFVPFFAKTFDFMVLRIVFCQDLHGAARILAHCDGKFTLELRSLSGNDGRLRGARGSRRVGSYSTTRSNWNTVGTIQDVCHMAVIEGLRICRVRAAMTPGVSDSTITPIVRMVGSLSGGQIHLTIFGVDGGQSTL